MSFREWCFICRMRNLLSASGHDRTKSCEATATPDQGDGPQGRTDGGAAVDGAAYRADRFVCAVLCVAVVLELAIYGSWAGGWLALEAMMPGLVGVALGAAVLLALRIARLAAAGRRS